MPDHLVLALSDRLIPPALHRERTFALDLEKDEIKAFLWETGLRGCAVKPRLSFKARVLRAGIQAIHPSLIVTVQPLAVLSHISNHLHIHPSLRKDMPSNMPPTSAKPQGKPALEAQPRAASTDPFSHPQAQFPTAATRLGPEINTVSSEDPGRHATQHSKPSSRKNHNRSPPGHSRSWPVLGDTPQPEPPRTPPAPFDIARKDSTSPLPPPPPRHAAFSNDYETSMTKRRKGQDSLDTDPDEQERSQTPVRAEVPQDKHVGTPIAQMEEKELSPLQEALTQLIRQLQRKDPSAFFSFPVTDFIAPGYSLIIKKPMDFSTMKEKVKKEEYQSLEELKADFKIMCENAMIYNKPETIYYKAAKKLLHSGMKILSQERLQSLKQSIEFMADLEQPNTPKEQGQAAKEGDSTLDQTKDPGEPMDTTEPTKSPGRITKDSRRQDRDSKDDVLKGGLVQEKELEQIQKLVEDSGGKLSSREVQSQLQFERRKTDGTTTLGVLNPADLSAGEPGYCPVKLGMMTGRLQTGINTLQGFKEDKRNKVTPISYMNYGPFSSYAPIYDSSFANISKEDSDLIYSFYGEEPSLQGSERQVLIQEFLSKAGEHVCHATDSFLDALTNGEHSRMLKEMDMEGEEQTDGPEAASDAEIIEPENSSRSILTALSSVVGLDLEGQTFDSEEASLFQKKLDETTLLLRELQEVQNERLSVKPPPNIICLLAPSARELQLAERVTGNLKELASRVTPGDITCLYGIRKAMGISMPTGLLDDSLTDLTTDTRRAPYLLRVQTPPARGQPAVQGQRHEEGQKQGAPARARANPNTQRAGGGRANRSRAALTICCPQCERFHEKALPSAAIARKGMAVLGEPITSSCDWPDSRPCEAMQLHNGTPRSSSSPAITPPLAPRAKPGNIRLVTAPQPTRAAKNKKKTHLITSETPALASQVSEPQGYGIESRAAWEELQNKAETPGPLVPPHPRPCLTAPRRTPSKAPTQAGPLLSLLHRWAPQLSLLCFLCRGVQSRGVHCVHLTKRNPQSQPRNTGAPLLTLTALQQDTRGVSATHSQQRRSPAGNAGAQESPYPACQDRKELLACVTEGGGGGSLLNAFLSSRKTGMEKLRHPALPSTIQRGISTLFCGKLCHPLVQAQERSAMRGLS
ncbi:BRD7 protein, partial [Atractosteus spatula]|nr:BRD7 protein [Atractosteus spatula]